MYDCVSSSAFVFCIVHPKENCLSELLETNLGFCIMVPVKFIITFLSNVNVTNPRFQYSLFSINNR